jgi:hypothetical protein
MEAAAPEARSEAAATKEDVEMADAGTESATEEGSASPSDGVPSSATEEEEEDDTPASLLWCSGDAPGSPQQHNFEGDWNHLREHGGSALEGPRPVYEHAAPDGTAVFLFFVESTPAGPAPRWVIGPTPGNGVNGWAYSDSTAARPEDILEPWHSWVKETSEWTEARLAFTQKRSAMGKDDDGGDDEDAAAEAGGDGKKGSGAKKGGGAKKKKAAGGAGAKPKAAAKGGDAIKKQKAAAKPKGK